MSDCKVPVLFLIFNRPDLTEVVFAQIKKALPQQLFIAADGPRKDKLADVELCKRSREVVLSNINWPCEVKTLMRKENLGCKIAVSSAINWFFEHVEEGIILEDDTVPDITFFRFCSELLEKYKDDQNVMSISGSNLLGKWSKGSLSYFRGHGGIWGWATWRRAWRKYDITMDSWNSLLTKKLIQNEIGTKEWFEYYSGMFSKCHENNFDTWDVQW